LNPMSAPPVPETWSSSTAPLNAIPPPLADPPVLQSAGTQKDPAQQVEEFALEVIGQAKSLWEEAGKDIEDKNMPESLQKDLLPRDKKLAEALQALVASGSDVDPRSALSQHMQRDLTTDDKAKLKAMCHKDKKAFRAEWAAKKLSNYTEEKTHMQAWKKIDTSKGIYMSASRVFQEEGGTVADIEAAKNTVTKCAMMGTPFVEWNGWSERFDFLYMKKEVREEMTKSWSSFQSWRSGPAALGNGGGSGPAALGNGGGSGQKSETLALADGFATPVPPATPKPLPSELSTEKARGQKRKTAADPQTEKDPKEKEIEDKQKEHAKKAQKALNDAVKVKAKSFRIVKAAENLFESIANDAQWKWASDDTTKDLKKALQVVTKAKNDFSKTFEAHELTDVKKRFTPEQLVKLCKAYTDVFDSRLDAVLKETTKLTKMHLIHTNQD
jgi:hypothetical protein